MKNLTLSLVAAFLIFIGTNNCNGDILVTATETGGNVVFSGAGTFNLTALTIAGSNNTLSGINASASLISMNSLFGTDLYSGFTGPSSFGTGSPFTGSTTASGSGFYKSLNQIAVPMGYSSGAFISSSMTFNGQTFTTLGLTPGTYVWNWGAGANADSYTLQIIPEPSSAIVLPLLAAAGMMVRRRRS